MAFSIQYYSRRKYCTATNARYNSTQFEMWHFAPVKTPGIKQFTLGMLTLRLKSFPNDTGTVKWKNTLNGSAKESLMEMHSMN